jgi:elongation factor Ts
MGQFASIIGMLREESDSKFPTEKLCHQICQHIIGMRPESLGTPGTSEKTRLDLLDEKEFEAEKESDDLNDFADVQSTQIDENETQLLRQSFMLQPSMTIHEYLNTHSAQLLWFLRLELGETPKDKS